MKLISSICSAAAPSEGRGDPEEVALAFVRGVGEPAGGLRLKRGARRGFALGTPRFSRQLPGVVTSFPNQSYAARCFPASPPSSNQTPEPTAPGGPFSRGELASESHRSAAGAVAHL